MKTLNGLPVYKMTIDENDTVSGVEFISLVDYPAIEVNWVAFSKNTKRYAFDADKQIVTGPVMIPNLAIYRNDNINGEYYVSFDNSEIEKIARKFAREQRTLGINYQHQENSQVKDAVIVEYWFITDKSNDKSNGLGFDLPVGTWMASTYIGNKEFWNKEVKSGNVRGYSIEGFLNLEMNKINKNKNEKMNNIKFKAEIKTAEGVVLYTPQDSFIVDSEVFVVDAEGNQTIAPDGDHTLENGVVITVAAGKITNVVEPQAQSVDEQFALTPEDVQIIMDAVNPVIKALEDRIVVLENQLKEAVDSNEEMKTAMSKLPGAQSKTDKDDKDDKSKFNVTTKLTLSDKLAKIKELRK